MPLTGKHILLISPQAWGTAKISKHHYAIELARRGNRVSFVCSTNTELPPGGFALTRVPESPGLEVLTYRSPFPSVLKFKLPRLFDLLMRWQARRILKALSVVEVDVVWDFVNSALFSDLRVFPAKCYLFHPVDVVTANHSKAADVVISLSEQILGRLSPRRVPTYFVNHGLGQAFVEQAQQRLLELEAPVANGAARPIQVGYAGNLMMPCIDRANYRRVIEENSEVIFHFWGPNTNAINNLGGGIQDSIDFVAFLRGRVNVRLHGSVPPELLARELAKMDALVVCYDGEKDPNGAANSHKILEYLSTGKTVISTYIGAYVRYPGMLEMLPSLSNEPFAAHFSEVISRLAALNQPAAQRARIAFSMEHTYPRQLDRIERVLSELKLLD